METINVNFWFAPRKLLISITDLTLTLGLKHKIYSEERTFMNESLDTNFFNLINFILKWRREIERKIKGEREGGSEERKEGVEEEKKE